MNTYPNEGSRVQNEYWTEHTVSNLHSKDRYLILSNSYQEYDTCMYRFNLTFVMVTNVTVTHYILLPTK